MRNITLIKQKHLRLVILGSITVDCRNGAIDPMSQAFIQMSAVFAELARICGLSRPTVYKYLALLKEVH